MFKIAARFNKIKNLKVDDIEYKDYKEGIRPRGIKNKKNKEKYKKKLNKII